MAIGELWTGNPKNSGGHLVVVQVGVTVSEVEYRTGRGSDLVDVGSTQFPQFTVASFKPVATTTPAGQPGCGPRSAPGSVVE